MPYKMNTPQGKCILAMVREGDFAHPGEEQAIIDASMGLPKDEIQHILDVGCGRGGTANWFYQQGWGQVTGIDMDASSIGYARRQYTNIDFHVLDILSPDFDTFVKMSNPFDLIYLFNVFYALNNQKQGLVALRRLCAKGANLLLCDYTLNGEQVLPACLGSEIGQPVILAKLASWCQETQWQLVHYEDWSNSYVSAYTHFVSRMEAKKAAIIAAFDETWYQYALSWYSALLEELQAGHLGGGKMMLKAV